MYHNARRYQIFLAKRMKHPLSSQQPKPILLKSALYRPRPVSRGQEALSLKTKRHWEPVLQQMAFPKKITRRPGHRKSSLQTTPHSPRSQAQIHLSRATSFHHLIMVFKSRPIQKPYNRVDLASHKILPLAYPQFRSHMDSPSGLILHPGYLKCHRLVVRHHWRVGYPLSPSPTRTAVQTCEKIFGTVSAVFDSFEARDRRDVRY